MMDRNHISEEDLSAYLDGEASEAAVIEQHLAECAECALLFAEMRDWSVQLQSLPLPRVRPAFTHEVMAQLSQEKPEIIPFRTRKIWKIALAAAMILILLGGVVKQAGYLHHKHNAPRTVASKAIQPVDAGENSRTITMQEQKELAMQLISEADAGIDETTQDDSTPWFLADASSWGALDDSSTDISSRELLDAASELGWFNRVVNDSDDPELRSEDGALEDVVDTALLEGIS